ncbi:indole-3-glycerol phosphate synthase TrpC [Desulfoscipio gibsoniae]|uniref:Indole-3-glycerol phosphate synthase n=1 Tax=Desulfoscipio gibsoniae DSM 7213 TaxID=767817 RepID=R4KRA5_9FIRM|nr:indole-3-glycerol phosphate synthase TrpC [Desulfoscipio gibsoniae]AGL03100.1 Indole-3-glycerol phosphate synthase [Desulfoscipio gibsoniae DSM 7213]
MSIMTVSVDDSILERILQHKREEVVATRRRLPLREIKERLKDMLSSPPPQRRDFAAALRLPGQVALIAEVKRQSPSRGIIQADFNPAATVQAYQDAGVDAISILTDRRFFGGAPEYLGAARSITNLPLLRKDFIITEYQIYETRMLGADAVLLLAGVLKGNALGEFIGLARSLGMEALVETRTPEEIRQALDSGALIIGINNRDLRTFQVDIGVTADLIKYIDQPGTIVVSESGIKTRADVQQLGNCGVDAVLVGEALMASGDQRQGVARLRGVTALPRKEQCGLEDSRGVAGV